MNEFEQRMAERTAEEKMKHRSIMKVITKVTTGVLIVLVGVTAAIMLGCPQYNVYQQRKEGEAQLAHAQSSKEVAVATAKAKFESADYEAKADVRRAEGAAQANKIIGDSLRNNEAYLRYLWIQNLEHAENKGTQVIYVPTEGNLPILEANRLPGSKK